jgi:hypothetical protein
VSPQIRRVDRHDDLVALAGTDLVIATGAAVHLRRLVRLHVPDLELVVGRHDPNTAHAMSAAMTANAATTNTMSLRRFTCVPNGLKPTTAR